VGKSRPPRAHLVNSINDRIKYRVTCNLLYIVYKSILQVDCLVPRMKFITMCGTKRSPKSTYLLFLDFAARKGNQFFKSV
jgi:hypothetical protein